MNEFLTQNFRGNTSDIDAWLNGLAKPGFGLNVVGYVAMLDRDGDSYITITVKRFALMPRITPGDPALRTLPPQEHPEEPSIQLG